MNHQTCITATPLPGGKKERIKNEEFVPLLCFLLHPILLTSSSSCLPRESWEQRTEGGAGGERLREGKKGRESKHGTEERERVDVKDRWQRFKRRGKVGAELATWAYCRDLPCFSLLTQTVILKAAHWGAAGTRAPKSERGIFVFFLSIFLH